MNTWVLSVLCGTIMFLVMSVGRVSPLFYVETIHRYGVKRQAASLPYTVNIVARNLAGPIGGYFGTKFGLKPVILFGCVMSSVGIAGCFFSEEMTSLTVLFGVIYGLSSGLELALLPSLVSLCCKKNISTAAGIVYGGASLGTFVMPLLCEPLLRVYELSGTFLVLSAVVMNSVPAAYLLDTSDSEDADSENVGTGKRSSAQETNRSIERLGREGNFAVEDQRTTIGVIKAESDLCCSSSPTGHCLQKGVTTVENGSETFISVSSNKVHVLSEIQPYSTTSISLSVRLKQNQDGDLTKPHSSTTPGPGGARSYWRLLSNPAYLLILTSVTVFLLVTTTNRTIIIDFARDKGIGSQQDIYFMMCIPLSDLLGRTSCGWVTDGGHLSPEAFFCLCFAVFSATSLAFVFVSGFAPLMALLFAFNFASGGFLITNPALIKKRVRSEHRTMALTSTMLPSTPFLLTISPLIGFFRGSLGSYDGIFYLSSAISLLGCGAALLIPICSRRFAIT